MINNTIPSTQMPERSLLQQHVDRGANPIVVHGHEITVSEFQYLGASGAWGAKAISAHYWDTAEILSRTSPEQGERDEIWVVGLSATRDVRFIVTVDGIRDLSDDVASRPTIASTAKS